MGSNFSRGANLATAVSPIVTPNISGYSPITLGVQLPEFLEFHERSQIIRSQVFKSPFLARCGHGGQYNYDNSRRCGAKITVRGKEVLYPKACRDPTVRIIWDGIHDTEGGQTVDIP